MKRNILFVLLVTSCFFAFSEDAPKTVLEKYLKAIAIEDYKSAYDLMSEKDKAVRKISQIGYQEVQIDLVTKYLLKKSKSKVLNEIQEKDKVTFTVQTTMPNPWVLAFSNMNSEYQKLSEAEKIAFLEKNAEGEQVVIATSEMTVVKEGRSWKVFFDYAGADKKQKELEEAKRLNVVKYKDKINFTEVEIETDDYSTFFTISGNVQNNTEKHITGLSVRVFGLDEESRPVFEEDEILLYSIGKPDDSIKPHYIRQFSILLEKRKTPKKWSQKFKIEVTEIDFAE